MSRIICDQTLSLAGISHLVPRKAEVTNLICQEEGRRWCKIGQEDFEELEVSATSETFVVRGCEGVVFGVFANFSNVYLPGA